MLFCIFLGVIGAFIFGYLTLLIPFWPVIALSAKQEALKDLINGKLVASPTGAGLVVYVLLGVFAGFMSFAMVGFVVSYVAVFLVQFVLEFILRVVFAYPVSWALNLFVYLFNWLVLSHADGQPMAAPGTVNQPIYIQYPEKPTITTV